MILETIKNLIHLYKNYGRQYKSALIKILLFSSFGIAVNIGLPLLSAKLLVHFTNSEFQSTVLVAAMVCVVGILEMIKMRLIRQNNQIFRRGVVRNVQMSLGRAILNTQQRDLDARSSGTFIQRLTGDTEQVSAMFTHGTVIVTRVLSAIGAFISVLFIDWRMFIYYIVAAAILTILNFIKHEKVGKKEIEFRKAKDKVSGLTGELVRGARDIKSLNAKESFMTNLDYHIAEQNERVFESRNIDANYYMVISWIKSIITLGAIVLMVWFINKNTMTVALAIAIYNYRNMVLDNFMEMISQLMEQCKLFNISADRVFSILNGKSVQMEQFGNKELNVDGNIEFKNVSFAYDDKKILNNLNFSIKSGETIGIVGASGAGKTTVFNLLCRLYDTNDGEVLIDGINIKEMTEATCRGNIALISQNPYIFNMSIKDNLLLINNKATEEDIVNACKTACLHDYIETLPEKYNTPIGEGGVNLSGGQRQRLAIARALLIGAKIILFDEATSALDNDTQSKIQTAIDKMKGDCTILIIAHRLSTIVNCDRIFMLKNGQVEDSGSHQELMDKNPEYAKMCKIDFARNFD